MSYRISPAHHVYRAQLSSQSRKTSTGPAAKVGEFCEDLVRARLWSVHQDGNNDSEERQYMQNEEERLDSRDILG
jgi:hypothetical protein